jgi:ribonuclease P protein component
MESLKKQSDFDRVFDEGKRYGGKYFSLVLRQPSDTCRLGIIVNKKFGGAVCRNRIKRQVRAAFRGLSRKFTAQAEFVVLPKVAAARIKLKELVADIATVAGKAGII